MRNLDQEEHQETRELVKSAFSLARALGIKTLVVQADEISDRGLVEQLRDDERVIWVARERKQMPVSDPAKDVVLAMPDAALNRLSQLNLALFLTALNRHLGPEEKVLGLSGVTGSQRLDTLVIAKPARDYSWLRHHKSAMAVTQHLARLLEIALHFAREGREGSSIGATSCWATAVHCLPTQLVAYLALADNVPRPLSNCPNGMHQPVISPRIRFFGVSCNPVDGSQAHPSCPASRSSHPLTLYTA